jgi:hypothetical protein
MIACAAVLALVLIAVVIASIPPQPVKFKNKSGNFVDPKTNITYTYMTPSVYEANGDFEGDHYGTMDGDKVYVIEGASKKEWLARKLAEGLITVYRAENVPSPELGDFEAHTIVVIDEDYYYPVEKGKLTDKDVVSAVVSEYLSATAVDKPEKITDKYVLRFVGDKYPFLFYCVQLVVTEDGYYYCNLENGEYYPASDVFASALGGES